MAFSSAATVALCQQNIWLALGFSRILAFSVCLSGVVARLFWQSLWLAQRQGCFYQQLVWFNFWKLTLAGCSTINFFCWKAVKCKKCFFVVAFCVMVSFSFVFRWLIFLVLNIGFQTKNFQNHNVRQKPCLTSRAVDLAYAFFLWLSSKFNIVRWSNWFCVRQSTNANRSALV